MNLLLRLWYKAWYPWICQKHGPMLVCYDGFYCELCEKARAIRRDARESRALERLGFKP